MLSRNNWLAIGMGIVLAAQGCAQLLGYDEDKPAVIEAGGGNGGNGGNGGAAGAGGGPSVPCVSASTCPGADDECKKRTCAAGTCGVEFALAGTVCNTSGACDGAGVCKKDLGTLCTAPEQCFNGLCVDGVCCDKACSGTCEACLADIKGQGTSGLCGPIKEATDPAVECASTTCSGAGACKVENGVACTTSNDCVSAFCVDGVCCDNACADTCKACNVLGSAGTCTNVPLGEDDALTCSGTNNACDGSGACKKENGQGCATANECASAFCVGGVCCSTACGGGNCSTGQCTCPGTTPKECNGVCKDLAIDDDHCGACAASCNSATTGIGTCSMGNNCINRSWAGWPMPNPASTGLPNPSNYTVDAANGTVLDNVTKLMWQRNVDPNGYTWNDAKTYCANLVHGGYSDWRLPTRIELVSIVDFTVPSPGPTIDMTAFPNTPSNRFWTSSPSANSPTNPWHLHFNGASVDNAFLASNMYRVRCVR